MLLATVLFLPLLAGVLALFLYRRAVPRTAWAVSFAAFGARVCYVLLDEVVGIYAGGGDQAGYDATFWFVAKLWRSGEIFAPLQYGASPGNDGYYMLFYSGVFSPAYAVFGHVTVVARLQMTLIGTLAVVNVYCIGRRLVDHRAGIAAAILAGGFPYWIILSGIIYRDMFIVFMLTLVAYYLVRWQSGERSVSLMALLLGSAALTVSLRVHNIPTIGAMFGTAAFLYWGRNLLGYLFAGVAVVGAAGATYLRFGEEILITELADRREWLARPAPGAYLPGFAYGSLLEMLVFTPIGALLFLLVPLPWHVVDFMALIAFAQNLFLWYPVLALSVVGFRDVLHAPRGKEMALPLVAFSLVGIFVYGLVEGNVGPAIRHRSQFQFVFFVLAGVAISKRLRIHLSDAPSSSSQYTGS